VDLKELLLEVMDWIQILKLRSSECSDEHGNKISLSIKGREIFTLLNDCQLLKRGNSDDKNKQKASKCRELQQREMHGARIVQNPSLCIALTVSRISGGRPPQLARDVSMSMTDTTLMETEGQHDAGI
jgi:hypothetical protein